MSTASTFTQRLNIADIPEPAKAIGAHLGAKLQMFQTDERTLTDELCDMLCIWLGMQAKRSPIISTSTIDFTLTLSKTTTAQEVKNGADLELIISSPLGKKRCLIQAKVLDPSSRKLRCDSVAGWRKLRTQLVASRKEVGDLAFLLIYVPGGVLNGQDYGYSTYEQYGLYEQRGGIAVASKADAYFGATFVAVDDLLGPSGRWRNTKLKVPQTAPGQFKAGVPLWQLFLELLLCRRSSWSTDSKISDAAHIKAFQTLSIGVSEIDWQCIQQSADQWLRRGLE